MRKKNVLHGNYKMLSESELTEFENFQNHDSDDFVYNQEHLLTQNSNNFIEVVMTDEELKALVASLAESQKHTDEQMKRTDEKLERIGIYLGNITYNQGDVAEEFFFNSLASEPRLGSICFDEITMNMNRRSGNVREKFDLFLTNGDTIAIVEVKYKAHTNDLKQLDRKMGNFKLLFPIYKDYKLYGALASFYINDDTKQEALKRGYFVLQRSGNLIHTECPTAQLKIG